MIWVLHCKPWSDFATTYEKFVENKKTTNEYKIKRKSKTLSNPRTITVVMQAKNSRILIAIIGALVIILPDATNNETDTESMNNIRIMNDKLEDNASSDMSEINEDEPQTGGKQKQHQLG